LNLKSFSRPVKAFNVHQLKSQAHNTHRSGLDSRWIPTQQF